MITAPGRYSFISQEPDGTEELVGSFDCAVANPLPLSAERIAAIKANPSAAKAVQVTYGCRFCESQLKVYAALERNETIENEGFRWYADIDPQFECRCGKTQLDISSVKSNLYGVLGYSYREPQGQACLIPAYEEGVITGVGQDFLALIDSEPNEEALQKFIERNPIVLHQFPSTKIFFKPSILGKFNADFALVTAQKELILIEIERPNTRLLKRDGGQASELQHAFDQVHSWLHIVDDHRLAVLDGLKIHREEVGNIRGVVIAGRNTGQDRDALRRLKAIDRGRISFLTYDDLVTNLSTLARRMGSM